MGLLLVEVRGVFPFKFLLFFWHLESVCILLTSYGARLWLLLPLVLLFKGADTLKALYQVLKVDFSYGIMEVV